MIDYKSNLQRVRAVMEQKGIDLMFLNYGPAMTYITGQLTPMYYDNLNGTGDWVTGVIFGIEKDPVYISYGEMMGWYNPEESGVDDVRVLPEEEDPDLFFANIISEFKPAGKTIAVNKKLWSRILLALEAAAPGARFVCADDEMMDRIRASKEPEELKLMARTAEITDQVLGPGKGRFDVEAPGLLVQRCQPTVEGSSVLQMGQCPTEPEFTVHGLEPIQIAPAKPVA